MSLQEYNLALTDIQYAIKAGLSNSFKEDTYWKMAICYKALGEEQKANISFNISEKLLGNDSKKLKALNRDRKTVIIYNKDEVTKGIF